MTRFDTQQTLLRLCLDLTGRAATFLLGILIARQLGQTGFGLYAYAIAVGFVPSLVADLGLQLLRARQGAAGGDLARPYAATALRLKGLLSLPVVILLFGAANSYPPGPALGVMALGLSILIQTFIEFSAAIYRGQRRILREAAVLTTARMLLAGCGAAALLAGGDIPELGLSILVASAAAALLTIWQLRHAGWFTGLPAASETSVALGFVLRQALPLGVSSLLSIAYTRTALLLLHELRGTTAVAWFGAAQRLVEPTQLLPTALLASVFPLYVQRTLVEDKAARSLALKSMGLLAAVGMLISLLLWATAPWLMPGLYGSAFQTSAPVLRLLSLSIGPMFVNHALIHFLIAHGRQNFVAIFMAGMLTFHLIVSWVLIRPLDVAGPAISMLLAELLLLGCCLTAFFRIAPRQVELLQTPATELRLG